MPALTVSAATLLACEVGNGESWAVAALRTLAVALLQLPFLLWLGRGIGILTLVRESFSARA